MREDIEASLLEIGRNLDSLSFPVIKNGGIVVPSRSTILPANLGKEWEHEQSGKRRSETGSRKRQPAGTQSGAEPSKGPGATSDAASLVRASVQKQYKAELGAVEEAYPGTQYWDTEMGMWLIVPSAVLVGLTPQANFLVGISFDQQIVRSWGFWGGPAIGFGWIGPRHTNFPDGSICAFEPSDQTWVFGAPLVALLDLYTLWALRQLHLQSVGRWPGRQAVPHAYERILELRADEYCGCVNSDSLYGECCMEKDLSLNQIEEAMKFIRIGGGLRSPPESIVQFMVERTAPPQWSDLLV